MKVIGYELSSELNGKLYIPLSARTSVLCPSCQSKLVVDYINPDFEMKQTVDLTSTADGFDIISNKFKEFIAREQYHGLLVRHQPKAPGLFALVVQKVAALDTERSGVRFLDWCKHCCQYQSVLAANGTFLKDCSKLLTDGIYRSDICFASADEKCPSLIVAPMTKDKMQKARLRGIHYEPIYQ
jgi:hypothetical protein